MMTNKAEMRARLEAIDKELWAIEMCDAYNRWEENRAREAELKAEKRAIIKALNE